VQCRRSQERRDRASLFNAARGIQKPLLSASNANGQEGEERKGRTGESPAGGGGGGEREREAADGGHARASARLLRKRSAQLSC
jgi:hypothetical protein